ncbi:hypothetical protein [Cryptosporangium minutisporangium]|uniref:hypothetical protein n=1 Tax=Cryptosporangium minutisporangium TaxID=113569 RepID=UPI0035E69D47
MAWAGFRTVHLIHTYRLLSRQATAADRPALGTITGDRDGDPVLLACDPLITPPQLFAIALRTPLPATALQHDAPLRLRAHGKLAEGEPVVAELPDGALLIPAGPAIPADTQILCDLLDSVGALQRKHQPH